MSPISKENILLFRKTKLICRAADHKLRQQILSAINEDGEITVTELYNKLHLVQSVASQHLAILRKTGFVKTRRDSKEIYYSIDKDNISNYVSQFSGLNETYT